MNVQDEQTELLKNYFEVRIWAAPATLLLYVCMGWLFGMQNAIYPLILTVFINLINIVCSWHLVYNLGYEAAGVALGTVIAQYAGLALAVVMILYKYQDRIQQYLFSDLIEKSALLSFLSINRDLFIRTIGLTFAFGFFYSQSSESGALVLAANVILLQLVNWMSYGIDGFAYASEALVGRYHGSQDEYKVHKAVRYSMIWGLVFAVLYAVVYGLLGMPILRIFTDDAVILNFTQDYLWWMIVFPIVGFACYIWDGIYIGLTASQAMRDTMLLALGVYLIVYYTTGGLGAMHQLWLSLSSLLLARGLIQTYWYATRGRALT